MSKSKIFLLFCIAFIVGVAAGRFISYQIMAIAAIVFIILGTVWYERKIIFILSIAGVVMLGGAVRFKIDYARNDLSQFYDQKEKIVGVIVSEPDIRDDKIYLTLGHLVIADQSVHSKMLISVPKFREFEYGEKLEFENKILEPKEYLDFSYKNYLSRFGIDAISYMPQVKVIDGKYGNPIQTSIFKLKKKFVENLSLILPDPHNSFLAGLLLGAKHSIPENLTEQFNRTGTSHIIAISGFNITIIAWAIDWLLARAGMHKRVSFGISIVIIILFVVMTGASASAVRAGVMGILLLFALNIGRVSVAANALAFTAVAMLLINPQILAFDVGFQLSFAALLGIVYLCPIFESYFLWVPSGLRPYLLGTMAAQIFTLPILLYNFGTVSVIALLPNILVLPLIPWAMLFGFLSGIASMLWLKLATPFVWLSWGILTYVLKVIEFFSKLKFASVAFRINFWTLVGYYLLLCVGIYVKLQRQRRTYEAK
jgi:competence protein ComEC